MVQPVISKYIGTFIISILFYTSAPRNNFQCTLSALVLKRCNKIAALVLEVCNKIAS